jgi:N-acetylneuraminic acid mutarotase
MARIRQASRILVLCTALSACGDSPTTNSTAPVPAELSEAGVQSVSNAWTAKRSVSPNRTGMVAAAVNGRLYLAGGEHTDWTNQRSNLISRVDAYDVPSNSWSRVASMPGARYNANGASVINGRIYVSGGRSSVLTQGYWTPTKTLFVYDVASNSWSRKADMPQAGSLGVQGVIGGRLHVYMPPPASGSPARFYRYDPATDKWVTRATPPGAVDGGVGGVINGKFYLAAQRARLQVYDPSSNTWAFRASMAQERSGAIPAVLSGKLYLIGGTEFGAEFTRPFLQVYDAGANSWAIKTPLEFGVGEGAAAGAGGKVFYIAGRTFGLGGSEFLPNVSEVHAYQP